MAESIVKIPRVQRDYDFIAFSFKGEHSYEDHHIYRVSDGSRYNENITPTLTDKTADVPGGDGMYFFGTECKQRNFTINFAFCDLTEREITDIRTWLDGKEMGDLWFAEEPHKVYTAKVTGTPTLKYLPFDERRENGKVERVYKGEGSVTFTAYWPYAHTPDFVENTDGVKMPGMYYGSYTLFSNYRQLKEVLPQSVENDANPYGDLPFHFKAKLLPPHSVSQVYITSSKGGDTYKALDVVYDDQNSNSGQYIITSQQSVIGNQFLDLAQVRLGYSSNTPYCFAYYQGDIVLSNKWEDDYSGIYHDSYAYSTLYFDMPYNGNLVVSVYQDSADNQGDFGIISHLDADLSDSHVVDTDESVVKYSGKYRNGEDVITYNSVSKGPHHITLKYYKDYDDGGTDDCFNITGLQAITL